MDFLASLKTFIASLFAAVENAVIQHGIETGITLTPANIRQTKFT